MPRLSLLTLILLLALAFPTQSARGGVEDNCAVIPAEPARTIRVAAVGDMMMGTTFPEPILPPEASLSPKCPKPRRDGHPCFAFRTPPRYAGRLAEAGFTAVNVANNHSLDFGMEGLDDTLAALDNAGVRPVGGERVAVFTVAGKSVAVAGFSYSLRTRYVHPLLDIEAARGIVAELKGEYDLVIVSFHGGAEGAGAMRAADAEEEFLGERRGNVIRFARAVVDAGADLVLGHGPHVPRAIEVYRGKLIAYSLGNFAVYSMFNLKGPSGLGYVLRAELDPETGDVIRFRTPSVALRHPGIPVPDPSGKAEALLRKLSEEFLAGEPDAAARRETLSRLWK
jgi:hypothetical protein